MITEKSVMFDFFDKKDNIIVKKYQDTILDIADKIFNSFGISKDVALVLADKLLIGGLKKEFIIQYTEHDRIIQYTSGGYYIKISALKLRKLENTLRELKNEGLQIREGLVCKLYLPNREEPVLVLQGRKRKIAGREFWLFSVRKSDYEKYSDERFTMVIESADERIQEISKMVMEFINEFRELSKNKETSVDELKESTRVRLSDIVLERARRYKKKYLRPVRRGRKKKSTQQRPASDPAPAPQPGGNEQAREVVVEKVEQVEQVAEEREPPAEKKTEASQAEQGKRRHVDREYYEKLRKLRDKILDERTQEISRTYNTTLSGMKYYKPITINTFKEYEEGIKNGELVKIEYFERKYNHLKQMKSYMTKLIDFLEENNYTINEESLLEFFEAVKHRKFDKRKTNKTEAKKNTIEHYMTAVKLLLIKTGDSYLLEKVKDKLKENSNNDEEILKREIEGVESKFYSVDEVREIIENIHNDDKLSDEERDELVGLIALLYVTGLRTTEALRIRLMDIDWDERVILLRPEASKKLKARPIFITEDVKDYLYYLTRKYGRTKDTDFLFNRDLRILRLPKKGRAKEKLKKIGIDINLKDLRKTISTNLEHFEKVTAYKFSKELERVMVGHTDRIVQNYYDLTRINIFKTFMNRNNPSSKELWRIVIGGRKQYDYILKTVVDYKNIIPEKILREIKH